MLRRLPTNFLFLVLLLIHSTVSIREEDDYDYDVGIAGNEELIVVPTTESPSHMHEDMTKLEKYLAKKTQSSSILPEKRIRMHLSPHVENINLNEQAQTMWISMRVCTFWIDPRVIWNPKDFNGQTYAVLHNWEVWSPSLTAINSVKPLYEDVQYVRIKARNIYGMTYLIKCPGMHTTVDCEIDAAAYPYDRQTCSVILSDMHYGRSYDLKFVSRNQEQDQEIEFPFSEFVNRTHYGAWHMLNTTFKVMTIDDKNELHGLNESRTNDRIAYIVTIKLEREATFYDTTFFIPALLFLSISAFSFMCRSRWQTLQLLSLNLLLLALFISSSYKRFPIHYTATPRIIAFWQFEVLLTTIQWILCVGLIMRDSRKEKNAVSLPLFEESGDEIIDCIRTRFFSLATLFFIISSLVGFVLLLPRF